MSKGAFTLAEQSLRSPFCSWSLAEYLSRTLDRQVPVLDLGCGTGYYISFLRSQGFIVLGFDGTPGIAQISLIPDVQEADLSQPFHLPYLVERSLTVLSLEVGEHIPPEFADIFLDNLARYSHTLILSWATPKQGGLDHVNERSQDWVIAQLKSRRMAVNQVKTTEMRSALPSDQQPWLRNNLLWLDRI